MNSLVVSGLCGTLSLAVAPDIGTRSLLSQAGNIGARNLFVNPAAIGFESSLNANPFLASFAVARHPVLDSSGSLVMGFGRLHLGLEQIPFTDGHLTRFSWGGGFSLSRNLFLGARHSLYRGDSASQSGFSTLCFALQFRPSPWIAFGGSIDAVNTPQGPSGTVPALGSVGMVIRPMRFVDLSIDVREESAALWRKFGKIQLRPVQGVALEAGFHEIQGWQVGIQLNLNSASFYNQFQPTFSEHTHIFGVDIAGAPRDDAFQFKGNLRVEINESLTPSGTPDTFLVAGRPSFLDLLSSLEDARSNPSVQSVEVSINTFPLGLGSALELHDAIVALRKAGKDVEVHLGQAGTREYLIASAANRILMEPSGELQFAGLSVQRYFLKGTLKKLGIEGEFLAKGDYKSAPEMFTRRESSLASRSSTMEELKRAEGVIVQRLTQSGRITPDKWKRLLQVAVMGADRAKAERLIDEIESGMKSRDRWARSFIRSRSTEIALNDRIAIIPLEGDIMSESPGGIGLLSRHVITPERVNDLMDAASADSRVRAIILRITSSGGEVMASHQISGLVAKSKKPVYVSIGDVAASGGYMISAPAKKILASELSYTGSIGVFLGKANLSGLYKTLDLNKEILSDAPMAGIYSEHRAWESAERKVMLERLDQYYENFTGFVAKERHLSPAEIHLAAQGRVWLGGGALEKRLIDRLGGMGESIRVAAEEQGLDRYSTITVLPSLKFTELFAPSSLVSTQGQVTSVVTAVLGVSEESLMIQWRNSLQKNPALLWDNRKISDR